METMSYNKINKKSSNKGVVAFFLFIILGTGLVVYSMLNEPEPAIVGRNALKEIEVKDDTEKAEETVSEETVNVDEITYKVEDKAYSTKNGKFSTNITIPEISINGNMLENINSEIKQHYDERAKVMEEQMKSAENSFTYKVTYKVYENKVDDKRIVSITVHERIVDNAAGSTTTDRVNGYNIDLVEQKIINQEDAASAFLGSNYSALIREQVKNTVIASKMIAESKYDYTITGLEQFYIKDNKFHMLLNEGEVVDKSYGVVDIMINN